MTLANRFFSCFKHNTYKIDKQISKIKNSLVLRMFENITPFVMKYILYNIYIFLHCNNLLTYFV